MSADSPLPKSWLLRSLDLETDSDAGPSRQVRNVLGALGQAADELRAAGESFEDSERRLDAYAERLRRAVPDLPMLGYWLTRIFARRGEDLASFAAEIAGVLEELDRVMEQVVRAGESLFPPGQRMLTLGHSETLTALLRAYGDRLEAINVSEGRPRSTGARLAREIAEYGLPVRLITEAQLELYLPDVGVAIVSARSILPDGTVVARVGSAVLARLCAAHGVPFYVVADRARWVGEGMEASRFVRVRRSPGEVCAAAHPGMLVSNVAYDATPPSLVSGYLTESGIRRDLTSRSAPDPTAAAPTLV